MKSFHLLAVFVLSLTGCVNLKIIHTDPRLIAATNRTVVEDKRLLISIVDRVTAAHGFRKYDRDLIDSPLQKYRDTLVYSGSYAGGRGVFVHIIAKDERSFPDVCVQGNGTEYSLIDATAKDILHELKNVLPEDKIRDQIANIYGV